MSQLQQVEPPIVSRLLDCVKTIRDLLTPAVNANATGSTDPIMVIIGYPTWTEAAKVWAQALDPGFVTVDALPLARKITKYHPEWAQVGPLPTPPFSIGAINNPVGFSLSQNTGVTPLAGENIHVVFMANNTMYDAYYQTIKTDTTFTIAAQLGTIIKNFNISGLSVQITGYTVTLSGAGIMLLSANGTVAGAAHKEVARERRTVQISIWTNSPWSRFAIHDAVTSTIGAVDNCWLTLPDYGRALLLPDTERWVEESQGSYNLYEAHLIYTLEYGVIQRLPGYAIGAVGTDTTINALETKEPVSGTSNPQVSLQADITPGGSVSDIKSGP